METVSTNVEKGNGKPKKGEQRWVNKASEYANRKTVSTEATIQVVCHQKSALLMDCMPAEDVENTLIRGVRKPPVRDAALDEMASSKVYLNDGQIVLPAAALFACLRAAGRKVKVGKSAMSTAKTTELPSILTIEEEFMGLFDPETGKPLTREDWKPDLRRGMMDNAGKKTAVGIVRPRFDRWAFKMTLLVDYSGMDGLIEGHIYKLIEVAGNRIGLLSWRPSCNGPMGRFKIDEFNVAC